VTNPKIGKGGNGFVFTMYHGKKQYAVKKVSLAYYALKGLVDLINK